MTVPFTRPMVEAVIRYFSDPAASGDETNELAVAAMLREFGRFEAAVDAGLVDAEALPLAHDFVVFGRAWIAARRLDAKYAALRSGGA